MINIKQLETEIKKTKTRLLNKALKKGLWENFGQKEVDSLEYKYGIHLYITTLENWCSLIDLDYLRTYEQCLKK